MDIEYRLHKQGSGPLRPRCMTKVLKRRSISSKRKKLREKETSLKNDMLGDIDTILLIHLYVKYGNCIKLRFSNSEFKKVFFSFWLIHGDFY